MQELDIKWIRLNTQKREVKAEHEEFYPLYNTELLEAVEAIRQYALNDDFLKKQKIIQELIDFIKDNNRALTHLTKDINKGMGVVFSEGAINNIVPIKYGMPILENILKGIEAIQYRATKDIGKSAQACATRSEIDYYFKKNCWWTPLTEPSMSMFYPDLEEQDAGLTKDIDVNIPSLNDTDAVKALPNGDYEVRVYLIFDRNRPRNSQSLGGRRYIIKDGVNRYKEACKKYEADKKEYFKNKYNEYVKEFAMLEQKQKTRLKLANDALTALNTIYMPISLLMTLVGQCNEIVNGFRVNVGARKYREAYYSFLKSYNNLATLNTLFITPKENMTAEQLIKVNRIAYGCLGNPAYEHYSRANILEYNLKKSA